MLDSRPYCNSFGSKFEIVNTSAFACQLSTLSLGASSRYWPHTNGTNRSELCWKPASLSASPGERRSPPNIERQCLVSPERPTPHDAPKPDMLVRSGSKLTSL